MDNIKRLMALFAGNETHYGTHSTPTRDPSGQSLKWVIKSTAKTLRGNVTLPMWADHVNGKKPLGIVPIRSDNTCVWGSIDWDTYGQDITALIKRVEALKLPLMPCRSKSGGLHLFLFLNMPTAALTVQNLLRDIAAMLGIAGSEIFPKQASLLSERGDQGSWIIVPYFGNTYDGKLERQVGIRNDGSEITLPEFLRLSEALRLTPDQLDDLFVKLVSGTHTPPAQRKRGDQTRQGGNGPTDDDTIPFGDGPPCLSNMIAAGGIKQGGQNNALCHMATYLKRKYGDDWVDQLHSNNEQYVVPPHPLTGMHSIIRSYTRRDYEYKCKDEPMRTYCNSALCRKRKFGVTSGGDNNGGILPNITSIKKMNSDPPIWFVSVESAQIECSTDDLQRWDRFQKLLMNKIHNPFGIIPQKEWLMMVQSVMAAMADADIIDVSPDVGQRGELHELLETYLTNRQRAVNEEDLLSGRPWEDEENARYYFTISKFHRFIEREGLKGLSKPVLASRINDLGGGYAIREVKGKKLNLHWIPKNVVQATPDIASPTVEKSPI